MNTRIGIESKTCTTINIMLIGIVVLGIAILGLFSNADVSASTGTHTPAGFSRLAETMSPAVVNIRTEKTVERDGRFGKNGQFRDFYDKFFGEEHQRKFKQRSLGSGFIIDKEGYIVTNNHVIENADKIKVKLKNGEECDAEIVGRDPTTDLALIRITSSNHLPVVDLGDSDNLKVGQWVVAIGSPFGLEHTVTAGIVSAKGRVIGSGPYDDFIQTDASINPGNSGGPLIDMAGKVVGINTAIVASGQGIGFAVPINMAKGVIEQLKESGEVSRGWLGVGIQPLSKEMAQYYGIKDGKGAMVVEAFPGDPAHKAGIRSKDLIVEVNGSKVADNRDLTRKIAAVPVGSTAEIKVLRSGKPKRFKVVIAKRKDAKIFAKDTPQEQKNEFGIQVSDLTPEIVQKYGVGETEGALVRSIDPAGKGAEAGIMVGDVIKEINHKPIASVDAYRRIVKELVEGEAISLFVWRRNAGFLVLKLTK